MSVEDVIENPVPFRIVQLILMIFWSDSKVTGLRNFQYGHITTACDIPLAAAWFHPRGSCGI